MLSHDENFNPLAKHPRYRSLQNESRCPLFSCLSSRDMDVCLLTGSLHCSDMDQPLDLSRSNYQSTTKKMFTIDYLTSVQFVKKEPFANHSVPPLHPVENRISQQVINDNGRLFSKSKFTEHVVPNVCSPPLPVKELVLSTVKIVFCRRIRVWRWSMAVTESKIHCSIVPQKRYK
jgi:hypothetical protein